MHRFLTSLITALLPLPVFMYFWSKNVTFFPESAFLTSFFVLCLFSLIIFCLCYNLVYYAAGKLSKKYKSYLFYFLISCIGTFLTFYMLELSIWYQRRLWGVVFFIVLFILLNIRFQKYIACFILILTTITLFDFIYNTINYKIEEVEKSKNFIPKNHDNIKFVHKPNIYVYWLESYQDYEMLNKTFRIHNDEFEKFLHDKNFTIISGVYSSAPWSLHAMTQLYSLSDIPVPENADQTEVLGKFRDILGGNEYNTVYKLLKDNGYNSYFFVRDRPYYYFHTHGQYLDEFIYYDSMLYRYVSPIFSFLLPGVQRFLHINSEYFNTVGDSNNFISILGYAINRAEKSSKPYIISFKGGVEHVPYGYIWNKRGDWIDSNFYQDLLFKSNMESEKIINYIIQRDPDSIILILGDHGPHTYEGFPINDPQAFHDFGITPKDIMDDVFNVFFAYRMPDGEMYDLSQGMYMNNINVFTHIFSYLARDKGMLGDRTRSESCYGNLHAIEGVLQ